MRLALKLGMSLARVKQEINSAELSQWMAFDKVDPFTVDRIELILARFMALIANMSSKTGNHTAREFLPFAETRRETDFTKLEQMFKSTYGANKSTKRKS